jgi:hypothetical protein
LHAEKHRDASEEGINKELVCSVSSILFSVKLDEEKHRNQGEFPVDKPMKEVQGGEGSVKSCLLHEDQSEKGF